MIIYIICWAECRRFAQQFLEKAADRIGGSPAKRLKESAATYRVIFEHLQACAELLPFDGKHAEQELDADRFQQMAAHVKQARLAEEHALKQLQGIISVL